VLTRNRRQPRRVTAQSARKIRRRARGQAIARRKIRRRAKGIDKPMVPMLQKTLSLPVTTGPCNIDCGRLSRRWPTRTRGRVLVPHSTALPVLLPQQVRVVHASPLAGGSSQMTTATNTEIALTWKKRGCSTIVRTWSTPLPARGLWTRRGKARQRTIEHQHRILIRNSMRKIEVEGHPRLSAER
jgi:hypothetical protein